MWSARTSLAALACVALGYFPAAMAATVEATLARDICEPYGGYFRSNTGWGMVGSVRIRAAGTGTYLDDIDGGVYEVLVQQRGMVPYYYLALFNETGRAATQLQCRDEQGLVQLNSGDPIRVAYWTDEALLTQKAYGLLPEPYSVTVDGTKLDGVYLGAAGQVRWGFKLVTDNGVAIWRPRLLLKKEGTPNGDALRDGEVAGYLRAASG